MLNGIKNILAFVCDNWLAILIIAGLAVIAYRKIAAFIAQDRDEQVAIAKAQIREFMLKLVSDAEEDYEAWNKAGAVKRAQVIQQIYMDYPILSTIVDQGALIKWIDDQIDAALGELRKIIAENK
jgi:hypothetical protein